MKTHKVNFTGNMEVFKSQTTKAHKKLQEYFMPDGEADKLVKTIDNGLDVTVYMPENGDVFLRFEHSLSGGRDLGVYKFAYEKKPADVIKHFKIITETTNNLFKKYMSLPNAGDLISKSVFEKLK